MNEHTLNFCICGERPNLTKTAPTVSHKVLWQVCCPSSACDIRSRIRGDADQAIADWNRQTATPNLLEVLRNFCDICEDDDQYPIHTELGRAAIAKAEPK